MDSCALLSFTKLLNMKALYVLTILVTLVISGCVKSKVEKVEASLNVMQTKEGKFLKVEIHNRTTGKIFINRISGVFLLDCINVIDSKGENITDEFIEKDLLYKKKYYENKIESEKLNALLEYDDLYRFPFTHNKELIKKAIDIEYKELITRINPVIITDNDVSFIRNMLFGKYSGTVFMEPDGYYSETTSINSLFHMDENINIVFHYQPNKKIDSVNVALDYKNSSIVFTSKTLDRVEDYTLFNSEFNSDTILILCTIQAQNSAD